MAEEKDSIPSSLLEETPIRAVVCLKRKEDVKRYEETEECFILDFDPFDSVDISKLSLDENNKKNDDNSDISIVAEKGQVACRDFPHARHLCAKFPFTTTPHKSTCEMCYCYVCDSVAPCKYWTQTVDPHCDADSSDYWEDERYDYKQLAEEEAR